MVFVTFLLVMKLNNSYSFMKTWFFCMQQFSFIPTYLKFEFSNFLKSYPPPFISQIIFLSQDIKHTPCWYIESSTVGF